MAIRGRPFFPKGTTSMPRPLPFSTPVSDAPQFVCMCPHPSQRVARRPPQAPMSPCGSRSSRPGAPPPCPTRRCCPRSPGSLPRASPLPQSPPRGQSAAPRSSPNASHFTKPPKRAYRVASPSERNAPADGHPSRSRLPHLCVGVWGGGVRGPRPAGSPAVVVGVGGPCHNHRLVDTPWSPDPSRHWLVQAWQVFVFELLRVTFAPGPVTRHVAERGRSARRSVGPRRWPPSNLDPVRPASRGSSASSGCACGRSRTWRSPFWPPSCAPASASLSTLPRPALGPHPRAFGPANGRPLRLTDTGRLMSSADKILRGFAAPQIAWRGSLQ